MADLFNSSALQSALEGTMFADKLQVFPSIDSTNTYAMQQGACGAPHGTVYVADEQTAGRGRSDHTWHSERHAGLYVSILLRPQMTPADALWLSLATGLAVQRAVENVTALVADIRWPNDLLLGSRKFGGILTEMNAEATRVRYAAIGIGINVNHNNFPPELRASATSLRMECDRILLREELLAGLLRELHDETLSLSRPETLAQATGSILGRIQRTSSWIIGKQVSVDEAGGYTGVTAGLDSRGFLRVDTRDGMRTVLSGGVRDIRAKD
ncbi:MAG: biotin--[acetyl-CoA-carboxylase] ligase [Acidobacteriaceae bacterium]